MIVSEWAYARWEEAKMREHQARLDMAYYEAIVHSKGRPRFELYQPDISLISNKISRLGPGGIPFEHSFDPFDLISPTADLDETVQILMARAGDFRRSYHGLIGGDAWTTPLIWDTGASTGLTPFRSDFCSDFQVVNMPIQAVGSTQTVTGRGTVLRRFKTRSGETRYLGSLAYYMPDADIRLESPQSVFQGLGGGFARVDGYNVEWHMPDGEIIDIPIDPRSNLPVLHDFVCSADEFEKFGPAHAHQANAEPHVIYPLTPSERSLPSANHATVNNKPSKPPKPKFDDLSEEHKNLHCCGCAASPDNQNLSGPQRELLLWHSKLCLNMRDLQKLMRARVVRDQAGSEVERLPPVIPTEYKSTRNLKPDQYPVCMACKLATAKTKSPKEKTTKPVKQKEGILSRDKYKPGDLISSDQFVVMTPGRLLTGYGREAPHNSFHGGTIYQDAASNLVRVQNQVTLGAAETVVGKANFEEWIWNLAGVLASEYHSDNGIFSSEQFRNDCINKRQKQSFSGVGAKHQNARAERTIQTISYWARHMMVHAAIHWPSDGANNIRLWAFAVNHAAWLYNRLPNRNLGWKSPLELFTESIDDHRDLRRVHVWGCPSFVLEAKLQDGQRIPKFNRRGRMGQFLGFSDQHSSTVGLVRNLATNFVSPQFHVVFDDLFTSIYNNVRMDDSKLENLFTKLFETCREWYGEDSEILYVAQ